MSPQEAKQLIGQQRVRFSNYGRLRSVVTAVRVSWHTSATAIATVECGLQIWCDYRLPNGDMSAVWFTPESFLKLSLWMEDAK
jgi:hypothetical protein